MPPALTSCIHPCNSKPPCTRNPEMKIIAIVNGKEFGDAILDSGLNGTSPPFLVIPQPDFDTLIHTNFIEIDSIFELGEFTLGNGKVATIHGTKDKMCVDIWANEWIDAKVHIAVLPGNETETMLSFNAGKEIGLISKPSEHLAMVRELRDIRVSLEDKDSEIQALKDSLESKDREMCDMRKDLEDLRKLVESTIE